MHTFFFRGQWRYDARLANLRIPLVLSPMYLLLSSSAACRYRARLGNDIGRTGKGTLTVDGMVYVVETKVSELSRSSVGRVYESGKVSTTPLGLFD